jgi:cysteine desulfurase
MTLRYLPSLEQRIPHNLNVSFNFVEGESMIMGIKGVAVSSGSACTSASLEPSFVLRALGRSDELAHSSIRFTLGRFTTEEDVDETVRQVVETVNRLRELSPLWEMPLSPTTHRESGAPPHSTGTPQR